MIMEGLGDQSKGKDHEDQGHGDDNHERCRWSWNPDKSRRESLTGG